MVCDFSKCKANYVALNLSPSMNNKSSENYSNVGYTKALFHILASDVEDM